MQARPRSEWMAEDSAEGREAVYREDVALLELPVQPGIGTELYDARAVRRILLQQKRSRLTRRPIQLVLELTRLSLDKRRLIILSTIRHHMSD